MVELGTCFQGSRLSILFSALLWLLSVQLHVQLLTQIPGGFQWRMDQNQTVIYLDPCYENMGRLETRIPADFCPSHLLPELRSPSVPKECLCSSQCTRWGIPKFHPVLLVKSTFTFLQERTKWTQGPAEVGCFCTVSLNSGRFLGIMCYPGIFYFCSNYALAQTY